MALLDKMKNVKVPSWMRSTVSKAALTLSMMVGVHEANAAPPKLESSSNVDRFRKEMGMPKPQVKQQKQAPVVSVPSYETDAVDPLDFPTLDELRARDYSDKKIRGVKRVSSGYISPYSPGRVQEIVDMVLYDTRFDHIFEEVGKVYNVPAAVLKTICAAESNLEPNAGNTSGAAGIAQIVGRTASYLGISRADRYDPEKAIMAQAKYMAHNLGRSKGKIVSANNRGALNYYHGFSTSAHKQYALNIGAVLTHLEIPTEIDMNYVMKVVHSPKTGKLVDVDREEFIAMNEKRIEAREHNQIGHDQIMLAYQAELEESNAQMLAELAKEPPVFTAPTFSTQTAPVFVTTTASVDNVAVTSTASQFEQVAREVIKPVVGPMPYDASSTSAKNNSAPVQAPAAKQELKTSDRVDQFRAQIQGLSAPSRNAAPPPQKQQDIFASNAQKMVYNDQNRAANMAGNRYAHLFN